MKVGCRRWPRTDVEKILGKKLGMPAFCASASHGCGTDTDLISLLIWRDTTVSPLRVLMHIGQASSERIQPCNLGRRQQGQILRIWTPLQLFGINRVEGPGENTNAVFSKLQLRQYAFCSRVYPWQISSNLTS